MDYILPEKCRSVVISAPNVHQLCETEVPLVEADDVLIKVRYVGVCSTDIDVLKGSLAYYKSGWAKYPVIPGHEISGIVASVGNKVQNICVGDKVVSECILGCGKCEHCVKNNPLSCKERVEVGVLNYNGAYTQYMKVPQRFVHKLANNAELKKACLIEPLAVVIRGIKKLVPLNETNFGKVAVIGFGTIGNLCAQFMNSKGYKVTVYDKNETRIKNIKDSQFEGRTEITGIDEFDYIIEATGNPEVLKKVLNESKTGVKILLLGFPYAEFKFNFESIVSFDKTIIGSVGGSRVEFDEAISVYSELNLGTLTQDTFSLEDYEKAWNGLKTGTVIKAILSINEE